MNIYLTRSAKVKRCNGRATSLATSSSAILTLPTMGDCEGLDLVAIVASRRDGTTDPSRQRESDLERERACHGARLFGIGCPDKKDRVVEVKK